MGETIKHQLGGPMRVLAIWNDEAKQCVYIGDPTTEQLTHIGPAQLFIGSRTVAADNPS